MATITKAIRREPTRRIRSRIRIGPGSSGVLMTPEQFDALDSDQFVRGYRYEIINGVPVVSPRPGIGEHNPDDELGHLIRLYRDSPPHGSIVDATAPERIAAGTNRRHADRVIGTGPGRRPVVDTAYRQDAAGPIFDIIREGESYQTDLLPGSVLPLSKLIDQADPFERSKKPKKNSPKQPSKPQPAAGGTDG